jgi:3-oxoacyl-[acyl-carrier-protein] synthase-1
MSGPQRQVITAIGLSNALGDGVDAVWRALLRGEVKVAPPPFELPFPTVCGAVAGPLEPLPASYRAYDTRLARLALRALPEVQSAVLRARTRFGRDRVALLVGTSTGGLDATEPAYRQYRQTGQRDPRFSLRDAHAFDALGRWLRELLGLTGPAYAVSTACTASAKALASARRLLRSGACDAVLVAGVDALCETTLRGFHGLSVLSERPARPFCAERDGIHIGEAAALLLLENDGDGPAVLAGVGESSDAHSMSAPHPEGAGAAAAMRAALRDAGLEPDALDYLNAHGTATLLNDAAEARAVYEVLGSELPVASTKGLTGHTLGACGATEVAFAALSLLHGALPASAGAAPVDPALPIHVLQQPLRRQARAIMSNALAFGGNNVSLVVRAP